MSSEMEEDPTQSAIKLCGMTQCMIDITAKQLESLRTQCRTTEEITQKEIREAEVGVIEDHINVDSIWAFACACLANVILLVTT